MLLIIVLAALSLWLISSAITVAWLSALQGWEDRIEALRTKFWVMLVLGILALLASLAMLVRLVRAVNRVDAQRLNSTAVDDTGIDR